MKAFGDDTQILNQHIRDHRDLLGTMTPIYKFY